MSAEGREEEDVDVHGEIAKALLNVRSGDTLEWDFATETERDEMRAVAAEVEPIIRRTIVRLNRWFEGCRNAN